jgi:hypothetical protein
MNKFSFFIWNFHILSIYHILFLFKVLGKHTLLIIIIIVIIIIIITFFFLLLLLTFIHINPKFVKISLRLFRTASNYIQGVYTRHIYIYIHIRVDWNLYFFLSLFPSFLYSLIRVLISIDISIEKNPKKKKKKKKTTTDQWILLSLLVIIFLSNICNKVKNGSTCEILQIYKTKSVSKKIVFTFFMIFSFITTQDLTCSCVLLRSCVNRNSIHLMIYELFYIFISIDFSL